MYATVRDDLAARLEELREQGLYKHELTMTTPQGAHVDVEGRGELLNLCAKDEEAPPDPKLLRDYFGMHRIEERPVVRDGQIVARPMMYLALSYDHRVVDGKEAVTFLVHVKEAIEDPKRLVLDL